MALQWARKKQLCLKLITSIRFYHSRVLAAKAISVNRAQEIDLSFLHNITHTDLCPEYNGFNTEIAWSQVVILHHVCIALGKLQP